MQESWETITGSARCSAAVRIPKISCAHDPIMVVAGIGAFGEVRMCVHRDTGAQRAVKVLRKSHMDEDEKKMLFNEINILRELVSGKHQSFVIYLSSILLFYLLLRELINNIHNGIKYPIIYLFSLNRTIPISSRCTSSFRMRSATISSQSKYIAATCVH